MYKQGAIPLLFHSSGVGNRLGTNPSTSRLPSWVPDWTNAPRYAQLKDFKAGGKVENKANRNMGRILVLSGFCVDSVDEVGPILRSATHRVGEWTVDEMRQLAIGYEKCWTQIKDSPLSRDPYPHVPKTQSLREAFHRTMVVNKLWVERWNKPSTELLDLFLKWEEELKYFLFDRGAPDPVEGDALYRRLQRMDRVTERVKMSWSGRLTFITKNGYIGLCPPYTQQGDLIAVARGLDVPVILRRIYKDEKQAYSYNISIKKYRLVGQCYAHGLMNGEALSMGTAEEEIEIEII